MSDFISRQAAIDALCAVCGKADELESYDQCYECSGYGDDYSFHDDGELVSNCEGCPWNDSSADSWDD